MTDQQETFTQKILIDAQQSLTELEKLRENIDAFKAKIKEVASTSGEDFSKIAESIKRATEAAKVAAQEGLEKSLATKKEITPEEYAQLSAPLKKILDDYKALTFAVQELKEEQRAAAQSAQQLASVKVTTPQFAQQVENELGKLRGNIDAYKTAIIQANQKTGESFTNVVEGIKRAAEAAKEAALKQLAEKGPPAGMTISQAEQQIVQHYQQDLKAIGVALKEVNAEQRAAAQAAKQFGGDATAASQAYRQKIDEVKTALRDAAAAGGNLKDAAKGLEISGKASPAEITQAFKELNAEQKNAADLAKKFGGDASAATQAYRQRINQVKIELQQLAAQNKVSLGDAAKGMFTAGRASAQELSKALKEINQEQRVAAQTAKQFGGDASQAAIAYRQRIEEVKRALVDMKTQQGITYRDGAKGLVLAGKASVSEANQGVRELTTVAQGAGGALSTLGTIGSFVFGSVLGITAIGVLRKLVGVFGEVTQAAIDFSAVAFRLELAVNGLRRAGMDTTLEEWKGYIDEIKSQFPIFSEQEITYAVSQIQLMTREFGLSAKQMQDVMEVSTHIALVTNKSLEESARGVAYALSSGYFETLQKGGFTISRFSIGQELLKRGFEGGYNATDEQTRALVTLELIMEQLAALAPDIAKGQDELFGKQKELTSAWADARKEIGEKFAPVLMKFYDSAIWAISDLMALLDLLSKAFVSAFTASVIGINAVALSVEALTRAFSGTPMSMEEFKNRLQEIGEVANKAGMGIAGIETESILDPAEIGAGGEADEEAERLAAIVKEMHEKIAEVEEDGKEKRMDIIRDYNRDIEKIERDHLRKLEDLWQDYQDKLADIATKRLDSIADANRDYQLRVEEEQRRFNFRREEAERKYREREIDAEAKFQERLRQLRENFLLNLEDAVRERDATQIMRLTRQYNLQRQQMIREEGINKEERKRQYQEEVRRIEQERQERMRSLALEHAERLREIDLQAQRERERAAIEYERRKADEAARMEERKQDREERQREQLEDLDREMEERISEIISKLWREEQVTSDMLDRIATLYEQTYGPGSRIDAAIKYYIALLASLAGASSPRFDTEPFPDRTGPRFDDEGFAQGGAMIARKPTRALFGEKEPELAMFIPLSKIGASVGKSIPSASPEIGARGEGSQHIVKLLLSPDLEARVMDQTLGAVGDVIFAIERAKK